MSCLASIDPDPTEVSGDQNGLCTVCQRLDLPVLTGSQCSRGHEIGHIHIGPLRYILEKRFCPCCRLIAAAVSNLKLNDENPETIKVTLNLRLSCAIDGNGQPGNNQGGARVEIHIDHESPHIQFGRRIYSRSAGSIVRSASEQLAQRIDDHDVASYRGQPASQNIDTTRIKTWIQACEAGHSRCCAKASRVDVLRHSIRLIDVHNFRIVESSLGEKYAALSYVWGSKRNAVLTSGNLQSLLSPRGLQGTFIPQTIADAIYLVRQLEIDYLWVDSLCIIQDDDRDKYRQLPIMDEIYQQAYLVVIAATGNDARAGLPGTTTPRTKVNEQSEAIGGIDFNTSSIALRQVLDDSIWATRGWTFQEGLLSRRALVITTSMAYWDCWESSGREDLVGDESKHMLHWNETDLDSAWRMDFLWRMDPSIKRSAGPRVMSPCRTLLYCEHVIAFQSRDLGNQSDALWAFLGILKLQKIRFQKGFIWAVPYERLDAALLWSGDAGCYCMHTREVTHQVSVGKRTHQLSFPSWSWLSCNTAVRFQDPCGSSVISKVIWHEPIGFEDQRYPMSYQNTEVMNGEDHEATLSQAITPDWLSGVEAVDFGLLHLTAKVAHLLVRWKRYKCARWSYATILSLAGEEIGHLWMNSSVGELQGQRSSRQAQESGQSRHAEEASGDEHSKKDDPPTEGIASLEYGSKDRISGSDQEAGAGESINSDQDVPQDIFDNRLSVDESSDDPGEKVKYLCEFLLLSANARKETDGTCTEIEEGLDCGSIKHIDECEHIESYNIMLIEWAGGIAYRRGLGTVGKDEWKRKVETQEKTIILG